MTLNERAFRQRGTFDQDREAPVVCRCGRQVTGTHPCQAGVPCPWDRLAVAGRYGVLWAEGGEA
jgi:hypothetical protein